MNLPNQSFRRTTASKATLPKPKAKSKAPKRLIAKACLGRAGENLSCWYLRNRGWQILARNYRCKEGELDIVAMTNKGQTLPWPTLIFVEVKTRQNRHALGPECSVSARKRKRILACLHHWIAANNCQAAELRCDIAAITKPRNGPARIRYYENAFTQRADFGW